ncbi:MAG: GNAT family N-acetyltransferase [Thermoleophilaceae bacterium]|nr:GNAT family N-acetyltransferase [Thermoleophilaceae bacterium]
MKFRDPELLRDAHDVADFDSGEQSLDNWLTQRAKKSQLGDTARTFVCFPPDASRVVGFVSLASGSVRRELAPGALSRNAPDPIPVAILARLAVDRQYQGNGLGSLLMAHALERVVAASEHVAFKAVVVNPISASAAAFYESRGFRPIPADDSAQYLTLAEIIKTYAAVAQTHRS